MRLVYCTTCDTKNVKLAKEGKLNKKEFLFGKLHFLSIHGNRFIPNQLRNCSYRTVYSYRIVKKSNNLRSFER